MRLQNRGQLNCASVLGRGLLYLAAICAAYVPVVVHGKTVTARPSQVSDDRFDDAVRSLRKVTRARGDAEHIRLLGSLRQLRDPDLAPLLSALSQVPDASIQVNAILGLAELSENQRIDVWKLSRVGQMRFQAVGVLEAFDNDLIGPTELNAILEWPDLEEELRVRVGLMLVHMGQDVKAVGFDELLKSASIPVTRAYAALALMQLGRPQGCTEALEELDNLPRRLRDDALSEVFGTISRLEFATCSDWLESMIKSEELSPSTASVALRALLAVAPQRGTAIWRERFEATDSVGTKMHLALMLLDASAHVPASAFSALLNEDYDLLQAIGRAGTRAADGETFVNESLELIGHHHPVASSWVVDQAAEFDGADASRVLSAVIADSFEGSSAMGERLELARRSAKALAGIDIDALRSVLNRARADHRRLTIDAILLGAVASGEPDTLSLVNQDVQWDSNRAKSLAVILRARHADELNAAELERLSLVFRGGGSIASAGEVQAAWLYLKHTDQERAAFAAVLGDLMLDGDR